MLREVDPSMHQITVVPLTYRDRYRLWVDLVRGHTDRLFIPAKERLRLGSSIVADIQLVSQNTPLEVRGTVIGWRPASARFKQGIFVRLHEQELRKCQALLGLDRLADLASHARRNYRVNRTIPTQLLDPPNSGFSSVRNISESGVLFASPVPLPPGREVAIELHFDEEPVALRAEVVWSLPERCLAGMQFVDVTAALECQLGVRVEKLVEAELASASHRESQCLLVDTDDEALTLEITALARPGRNLIQCRSGDEALAIVRANRPQLVLIEVLVPEISGAEVCHLMRMDAELASIPVVLTSPLPAESLKQIAAECGASDYLTKPLRLTDLARVVARNIEPAP